MGGRSSLLDCVPVLDPRVDWRRAHVNVGVSSGNSRAKRETKTRFSACCRFGIYRRCCPTGGVEDSRGGECGGSLTSLPPARERSLRRFRERWTSPPEQPSREGPRGKVPNERSSHKGKDALGARSDGSGGHVHGHRALLNLAGAVLSEERWNVAGPECVIAVPHRFLRIFPSTV